MPKVSDEHRERVRRRLLDAAKVVVLRDGHERATTRAILDEAGMSAGTLYNYFPSKAELFEALIEDVVGDNATMLAATDEGLVEFVAELMAQPDTPAMSLFRGHLSTDPDQLAAQRRLNAYIVGLFSPMATQEQADGVLGNDLDAQALVELVDIVHDGMNRRNALGTFVTSYERVGTALLAVLTHGAFERERSRT